MGIKDCKFVRAAAVLEYTGWSKDYLRQLCANGVVERVYFSRGKDGSPLLNPETGKPAERAWYRTEQIRGIAG